MKRKRIHVKRFAVSLYHIFFHIADYNSYVSSICQSILLFLTLPVLLDVQVFLQGLAQKVHSDIYRHM